MKVPIPVAEPRSVADLRDRRTVVLGLARSGVALARMLTGAGAHVTVYDRRPADDLAEELASLAGLSLKLALAEPPEVVAALLREADLVFTSPSISADFSTTDAWLREAIAAARARGVPVLSEVDLFLRLTRARTIGITGTKGKTTTTALLGAILAEARIAHVVGGNIGRPLVELVDTLGEDEWAVIELSELQLPTISRGVDVAVYTNILADHLDRHGSVDAYRAVKARLAELAPAGGSVVLNADDAVSRDLSTRLPGTTRVELYALERESADQPLAGWIEAGWLTLAADGEPERIVAVDDIRLPGRHMRSNVLAGAVAGRLAGAPAEAIAAGIRGFDGVTHRLETIAEIGGVRYVNDSQATIPLAAVAGLDAFDEAPVVLIAGGRAKGLDYAELGDVIARRCRAAVLIGEAADDLESAIRGRVPVQRADSMEEAVVAAAGLAQPGDVLLLAPAAASFDMFIDYAARGDAFRRAVEGLGKPG